MPPLAVHFVSLIILVALAFDFINGFHDAANSIATVVSTRVLSPRVAVVWAAFFNFVAAFGLGVHVATTIGKGVVDPAAMTNLVVVAALAGAIVWDLITWYYGLPVSSSHALIGGLVGAALAAAGARVLVWSGIQKIVIFIVLSPVVGMLLGFLFMVAVMWIARNATPMRVDRVFRRRPRVDHPHDLRGNHGRGRDAAALRGPVGGGDADRVGLDPDHPGFRARGHPDLLGAGFFLPVTESCAARYNPCGGIPAPGGAFYLAIG